MVQYDKEILSLYTTPSVDGLSNVVKRVTWRYQAKEDTYVADIYKDTFFETVDPNNFVNYSQLTEETVLGWIASVEDMNQLKQQLDARLADVKAPAIVEKKIPWDKSVNYTGNEKYVLVNEGTVVFGPRTWDSDIFNDELEKLGLEESLPVNILAYKQGLVPIDTALTINENVKIYQAVMVEQELEDNQYLNESETTWNLSSGKAVGSHPVITREPEPEPTLDQLKEQKISQLRSAIDDKETNGSVEVTVTSGAGKFRTDNNSVLFYIRKQLTLNDDQTNIFADKDGNDVTLDKEDFASVIQAVETYIDNYKSIGRTKIKLIKACTTKAELDNISLEIE
jgi:hypothetical protein